MPNKRRGYDRGMKKLTAENYTEDKYYPMVVKAVNDELIHADFVSAIVVFQRMKLLDKADVEKWKKGQIPFLEKMIMCNLSKANRILRLIRFHAHDLYLKPSITAYQRKVRWGKLDLRFSKTGTKKHEEAYARHFVKTRKCAAK